MQSIVQLKVRKNYRFSFENNSRCIQNVNMIWQIGKKRKRKRKKTPFFGLKKCLYLWIDRLHHKRCNTSRLSVNWLSSIRKVLKEMQINCECHKNMFLWARSGLVTVNAECFRVKEKGTSSANFNGTNYVCKITLVPKCSEELLPCKFKHLQQLW